jgi:hypothetical protein
MMTDIYIVVTYWDGSEQYGYVIEGVTYIKSETEFIVEEVKAKHEKQHKDRYDSMKKSCPNQMKPYTPLEWKPYIEKEGEVWGVHSYETYIEITKTYLRS